MIISEGLFDKEFVSRWCYDFDKLRELVNEYSLEKVSQTTGVPVEKIQEAARVYATNRPGASDLIRTSSPRVK